MKTIAGLERQKIEAIMVAIRQVAERKDFILGKEVSTLENRLAESGNMEFAIGTSSGTTAQFLILKALGIGPGDVVFVPDFTFVATASVVKMVGATPVFVDVSAGNYTMSQYHLCKMITEQKQGKAKAIIPVSLFGCGYNESINDTAEQYGLHVIEDACHSIGTPIKAPTAFTSFFPTKPLGAFGDAGMIFTNDSYIAERVSLLRSHNNNGKNEMIGYNARMNTFQAAVLLEKMLDYPADLLARANVANLYRMNLDRRKYLFQICGETNNAYFSVRCKVNRTKVIAALTDAKIPYAIYYDTPLHRLPPFYDRSLTEAYTISNSLSYDILQLPQNAYMKSKEVIRIANLLNGIN